MSDDNPWDDAAFKMRVKAAAKKNNITLRDALLAAGVARGHLDRTGETRSTATILRLAKILDVSPAYLFGVERCTAAAVEPKMVNGTSKPDRNKQIALYTKLVAAQLATLVYMSSDNSDEKSQEYLMDFVLRVIDQVSNANRSGREPGM